MGSITNTSGERHKPIGRISGRHTGGHILESKAEEQPQVSEQQAEGATREVSPATI